MLNYLEDVFKSLNDKNAEFYVLSIDAKTAAGRHKDLEDVRLLQLPDEE